MGLTVCPVPEGYPSEIVGYAQPWIVNPGDEVDIMVRQDFQLLCNRQSIFPIACVTSVVSRCLRRRFHCVHTLVKQFTSALVETFMSQHY